MRIDALQFAFFFILTFVLSATITPRLIKYCRKKNIVDIPEEDRKVHKKPTPLLGGMAVFLSFVVSFALYLIWNNDYFDGYMLPKYIIGIFVGGALLMIGGYLDDRYNLSPGKQIMWPIAASVIIIISGIGIDFIPNPFGNVIDLNVINIQLFEINNVPYYFTPLADIFTFVWLMGLMYTTKFLDGLDGLVSGISVIGSVILFILSLSPNVMQPETAFLAILLAGAVLGFLIYNFNPAKIFLGEGGSLWLGFILGIIAIISGGKIATAILIMGIPILDVMWVITRRLWNKKSPFKAADKKHLHHRLLDIGLSHRSAVITLYVISAIFGSVALIFEGKLKFMMLVVLIIFMVIFAAFLIYRNKTKNIAQM